MWNGKKKAITFSFDDGVTQDERLVSILNKYGLKCTFNINSSYFGLDGVLHLPVGEVRHDKCKLSEAKRIYAGHEVAVHTLTHPNLTTLDNETVEYQVEEDRKQLSKLFGYEIVGMAYPCGGTNNDDRVAEVVKEKTGVQYARTITSTYSFDLQKNLYRFNPTVHFIHERLEELVDKFLALETDEPQLLYIWGHSYELDAGYISWDKFEALCEKISGKTDIFYGTNKEVLL